MEWIDIVFIAVILVFAVIGLWKGLFDSILSLCASVASIFLAFWASKPVAEFLNRTAGTNNFFKDLLTKWNVPTNGTFSLEELASVCSLVLSVIIVFVLIKAAVWLLAKLFDSVTANSTPLSGMNRLLGLVFGAVQGFAVVLILLGLTSIASTVSVIDTKVNNFLENSSITRHTYVYVDEWVDKELQDKIEDFIKDLAKKAPKNEDDKVGELLERAAQSLKNESHIEGTTEITLVVPKEYTEENNVKVTIEYESVQVKAGDETVQPEVDSTSVEGQVKLTGLTENTEYTVTLTVKVTYDDGNGHAEYASKAVVLTLHTTSAAAE